MKYLFFIIGLILAGIGHAQLIYTQSFTDKLEQHDLDFYLPVERWMKATPLEYDGYLNYDLVLHSPPGIEVRIDIDEDGYRLHPSVEINRTLATISSNDEDSIIEFTVYPRRYTKDHFGADLALYADFDPKPSFTQYPNGRMLAIYKDGKALVKYIILFEKELDPFFKLPIKFKKEEPK